MEWIKFKNTYSQLETFEAGTLLKLKNGKIILVGDVNKSVGYCDCCMQGTVEYFSNDCVKQIGEIIDNITNKDKNND